MNDAIKMQISAFVDGELPQNETELLLRRLCQDRALRQQAREYLSVGRVMRGERVVAGMASLRDRISAELDESGFEAVDSDLEPKTRAFVRPIAGVAIAASVALIAVLGLQQMSVGPPGQSEGAAATANAVVETYTVPESQDDPLLDYARRHNESVQFFDTQLVTYPLPEEALTDETQNDETDSADVAETPAP